MAMNVNLEKLIIDIPNSEAIIDCQIDGKNSYVGGYYTNDDSILKKQIESFFEGFNRKFVVDYEKTQTYINEIKLKVIPFRESFKSSLDKFENNANYFVEDADIPPMFFGGRDGRYLKFENDNVTCKSFLGILLGSICRLVIEKHTSEFRLYPVLKNNYLQVLSKKGKVYNNDELAKILDCYYETYSYKKIGIYMFGKDFCDVLFKKPKTELNEIILKTKNIASNQSYEDTIIDGVQIGVESSKTYVDNIKFPVDITPFLYETPCNGGENLIVYGTPGCGKSYYVQNTLIKDKKIKDENVVRTTFYQDYSNTDFVGQILPKVNSDKSVTYEFNPGPFTIALEKAIKNPNENVALVIEELNRGNAASIFGDIFQLLDRKDGLSEYALNNVNIQDYLNKKFKDEGFVFENIKIPGNMYIYATMNTSDQNVFTLDTAFKRRWKFKKLLNKFPDDHKYATKIVPGMSSTTWKKLVDGINEYIKNNNHVLMNEDKQLGIYFIDEDTFSVETFNGDSKEQVEAVAYKLLEYLWDDVVKFNRSEMFKNPKTLDDLVEEYKQNGEGVFVDGIIKK